MRENKFLLISILALFIVFASCKKDEEEDDIVSSKISIIIKNQSGEKQKGIIVYMFDKSISSPFGNDPLFSKREVVTNSDGIATFELRTFDLEIINTPQKTFYFVVFDELNENVILGHTAVTIKEGETKSEIIVI